jgi:hypothetical protein
MGYINKGFCILLATILTASTLIAAESANAQTIPKPPVPEFTLRYYNSSYDTQATTTTDPYTGQQITDPSRYIEETTLEIRIENTAFTPFQMKGDNNQTYTAEFLYNIHWKPHYSPESDWESPFYDYYLPRSSTTETIYEINMINNPDGTIEVSSWSRNIPDNATLDFQVQAMIGAPNNAWIFTGKVSNWSNTQTINIGTEATSTPKASTLPSQTPTATSQTPNSGSLFNLTAEQTTIVVMALVIAVLAVSLAVLWRKKVQPKNAACEGVVAT